MRVFITGTDTNIGKTLISSWLCLHTNHTYFKPIQTGSLDETDSKIVSSISKCKTYKEIYLYKHPLSPHLAAYLENEIIDIKKINLPDSEKLIVEGAGGVLVPLNKNDYMIDLIEYLSLPIILVASSRLGTINHTLLTLEALKMRNIEILGVIISGRFNQSNREAIEFYGKTKVLAEIPYLKYIDNKSLNEIQLTQDLKKIFKI